MKGISILGSTGSIGRQTLEIIGAHPQSLKVVALAAGLNNIDSLAEQIEVFGPELVALPDAQSASQLTEYLSSYRNPLEIVCGESGLNAVATHPSAHTVVTAVVGFLGLLPTAAAIACGKTIALANKETLVAAGSVIIPMARQHGAQIVPVDSEHSAIFQSLAGHSTQDIERIWLTASGGPFRSWTKDRIASATVDDALCHPNWSMGPKITIDSATLMNKGLEIIEARWLFDIDPQHIKVVVHPQSILHSAVEFVDGSVVGQMGLPDMRLPIHYALFWPDRTSSERVPRLDLVRAGMLTFEEPDRERFPCLALAENVAGHNDTLPSVLNAANEVAVSAFLKGTIAFSEIPKIIERVLNRHTSVSNPSLTDILESDKWARHISSELTGLPVGSIQ